MKNDFRPYLFGIDRDDPMTCAARLAELGIGAVVISGEISTEVQQAAERHQLALYSCYGAFSLGQEFASPANWARDVHDKPQRWFSSGCPNDPALRQMRLQQAVERAQAAGVQGLFVDGARFASPASGDSFAAFLTCFCPHCRAEADTAGFDLEQMRRSVLRLSAFVRQEASAESLPDIVTGLADWLAFRRHCMCGYYADLIQAVRQRLPQALVGAFIFTASLADWVGQAAEVVAGLDVIAPMLYRRYPAENGPACLNHEWACLLHALTAQSGLTLQAAVQALQPWSELSLAWIDSDPHTEPTPDLIRRQGFLPDLYTRETAALVNALPPGKIVAPIIQLEDDRLNDSITAVRGGGANGFGFFAYRPDLMHNLEQAGL